MDFFVQSDTDWLPGSLTFGTSLRNIPWIPDRRHISEVRGGMTMFLQAYERIKQLRGELLKERELLRKKSEGVKAKRIEAGDAEAELMTMLRISFLQDSTIQLTPSLRSSYDKVEKLRDALAELEDDYLESERALSGYEWEFTDKEETFYDIELQELLSNYSDLSPVASQTAGGAPLDAATTQQVLQTRPPPPSEPPPSVLVSQSGTVPSIEQNVSMTCYMPPPPPPPTSAIVSQPSKAPSSEQHPSVSQHLPPPPPPLTRVQLNNEFSITPDLSRQIDLKQESAKVVRSYATVVADYWDQRREFDKIRPEQAKRIDGKEVFYFKSENSSFENSRTPQFVQSYFDLLQQIVDCECEILRLRRHGDYQTPERAGNGAQNDRQSTAATSMRAYGSIPERVWTWVRDQTKEDAVLRAYHLKLLKKSGFENIDDKNLADNFTDWGSNNSAGEPAFGNLDENVLEDDLETHCSSQDR